MRNLILIIIVFIPAVNYAKAQEIIFNDTISIHLKIGAKQLTRDSAIQYSKANYNDTLVILNNLQVGSDSKFYLTKENILMKIYLNKKSKKKGGASELKIQLDKFNRGFSEIPPTPFYYTYVFKSGNDSVLIYHSKGKDWENFAFLYFIKNSTQYIKADLYFHPVQKKNANRLLKELAKGVLIFYKVEFDGY